MEGLSIGVDASGNAVKVSAAYMTRHGLIAGSTGTGKSRTMQVLAEQLSDAGANVFVSDVKGDASGFCATGIRSKRNKLAPYQPHALECNYWSAGERFIPLRFSISEIGPVLFSRMLSLNSTQESHVALVFSYARKHRKSIDDLGQFLAVLDEMASSKQRGISGSSLSVIERKIIALEESGVAELFGRPAISAVDLAGLNVLNLSNSRRDMSVSIAPAFLLQLLFSKLPEVGDLEKPKFAIFFDEAHYLFKDSNKSLRDLMVTMLKQIRSKGVSVFFVTQDVADLPEEILSQLSTKIIFSQKAFTQRGNKRLSALAKSFPASGLDVMEKLKTMPPGVAIVSSLDETGEQTAPVETTMFAPATSMGVLSDSALLEATDETLMKKYRKSVKKDRAMAPIKKAPRKMDIPERPRAKKGGSFWDTIFKFLLKLLAFILKAGGMLISAVLLKPGKKFLKWLFKKPIRIFWLLLFLLIIYVIWINQELISSMLATLKFS